MPLLKSSRITVTDSSVISVFEHLANLEGDTEVFMHKRTVAWELLWLIYPEVAHDSSAFYNYRTHELVVLSEEETMRRD
jgi:hypothetical protein